MWREVKIPILMKKYFLNLSPAYTQAQQPISALLLQQAYGSQETLRIHSSAGRSILDY